MKGIWRVVGIIGILVFVSQVVCYQLDERANSDFAAKANAMQIKGKTKDFVLSVFGPPAYQYKNGTVWVYTPGPAWTFWRHECKIGFDSAGLVDGWIVRSD